MSNQWHYSQDGAQYGPVDEAEIVRLIQSGELAPGTPVLKVGSMDWQPARNHACFQVEIFPKKMRESVQAAASTASKPASGGTSQSPRQATAQPAATSSPAATTAPVKKKKWLPWVVFGSIPCLLFLTAEIGSQSTFLRDAVVFVTFGLFLFGFILQCGGFRR